METAKIRIGKDFTILWRIYKKENGEKTPYMLAAGKENYILRLWTPYGKQEITRFEIDENTIQFDFLGKDQKHLGNYSLELVERKNAIGMVTVDTAGFTLVAFSRYETDGNNSDVVIQDVKLETELGLTPIVSLTIDTEFSDTSHNAVSNYVLTEKFKQVDEKIKVLQSAVDALDMKSIEQAIANKVDKVEGKTLSSNDFTDAEKSKLEGVEDGAQKNDYGLSGAITYPLESINADGTWEMVCSYAPGVPAFLVLTNKPDYVFQLTAGQEEQIYDVRLKRDNKGIYIQTTRTDVKRYALLVASSVKKLSENYISDAIARNADVDEKLKTKQDVVEDLATIRSGAAKGATAVQNVVSSNSNYAGVTREGYEWIIMPKTKKVSEAGDPVDHLSGIADAYDVKQELAKKVDKVSGKQLSAEDFTTALKQKLQSLNNYDDSALTSAINSLQNQINTLVSGNASSAIDTFNEIIAFLNGVKDTQDLAGIIASIEQQIASVNNSLSAELAKKPNKTELATINGQSLTNGGNIVIEGKNYDAELAEQEQKLTELSAEKEDKANKVTSLTDESTDEQYPSAKAVYALKERISENEVLIEDLQNTKIEKENDDYYPKMAVGTADNLAGVDEVDSEFNFRQSGGGAISDGVARVQSIKGNSVVWNQHSTIFQKAVHYEPSSNTEYLLLGNIPYYTEAINNHTIFAIITGAPVGFGYLQDNSQGDIAKGGKIYVANTSRTNYTNVYLSVSPILTDKAFDAIISVLFVDLTQMFGAGNEPTTIEEFYQRIPMGVDLNAYNEGEIIDMKATGIISKGVNAWDEEWEIGLIDYNTGAKKDGTDNIRSANYTRVLPSTAYVITAPEKLTMCFYDKDKKFISYVGGQSSFTTPTNAYYILFYAYGNYGKTYKNDICINISNADINGKYFPYEEASEDLSIVAKYFPNGMRSAGSAHDEIRYNKATNKWEAVKRIGAVNLGDLKWTYQSASQRFYSEHIADIKFDSSTSSVKSKNARYQDVSWGKFSTNDKVVSIFTQEERNKRIYIKDSAYTDEASLKAALQGVILYYELAEPIVTEIEEKNFNLDYKVWNNGTEQAIAEGKSSALSADITYGFNAIGKIKKQDADIAAIKAALAKAGITI